MLDMDSVASFLDRSWDGITHRRVGGSVILIVIVIMIMI